MSNLDHRSTQTEDMHPGSPHRLPVPYREPPYDSGAPPLPVRGTLALAFPLPRGVTAMPEAPAPLKLVPSTGDRAGDALPDVEVWARRMSQAVVEVLAGDRPLHQLVAWTSERVYRQLAKRLAAGTNPAAASRDEPQAGRPGSGPGPDPAPDGRSGSTSRVRWPPR